MGNPLEEKLIRIIGSTECSGPDCKEEPGACGYRKDGRCSCVEKLDYCVLVQIAKHLISNGLFISPVKVGDMLWPICWDGVTGEWYADNQPERVNEVGTKGFFLSALIDEPEAIDEFYPYEMIGDEYFLSHEEAVAAAAVKEKAEVQE